MENSSVSVEYSISRLSECLVFQLLLEFILTGLVMELPCKLKSVHQMILLEPWMNLSWHEGTVSAILGHNQEDHNHHHKMIMSMLSPMGYQSKTS